MSRVTPDEIREHLRQGFGMRDYYIGLREQSAYMLTGSASNYVADEQFPHGEHDLPMYPDVPPRIANHALSRRILNSAIIAKSRMMGADPLPVWPDLDPVTREFRQEAFQRRYREMEMQTAADRMFDDGYNLGVGFCAHGLVNRGEYQVCDVEHIPATNAAWDPTCPSPAESPWLAICRWMTLEEAKATYPRAMIDKGRSVSLMTAQMSYNMEVVRVVEYWHKGSAAFEPTYCVFAGPLATKPVIHQSNPYGNRIPVSFYVHLCPSMMQRPIGAVWLQVASQEQINAAEKFMLDRFYNGRRGEILDPSKINPVDWKAWKDGKQRFMRTTGEKMDVREIYQFIPESPIEASTIQVLQYFESRSQEDSGLSDLDRGAPLDGNRSATEASILDQRAQSNQAFVARNVGLMMTRLVDNVSECMKRGDTAPCPVEFGGEIFTINGDEVPELTMAAVFEQESMVKVDQDSLTSEQSRQKKRAKAQDMMTILGTPIGAAVPPMKALEVVMKNLGFEKEWAEIEQEVRFATDPAMQPQPVSPATTPGMSPQGQLPPA